MRNIQDLGPKIWHIAPTEDKKLNNLLENLRNSFKESTQKWVLLRDSVKPMYMMLVFLEDNSLSSYKSFIFY